jgi:hypothetical protein
VVKHGVQEQMCCHPITKELVSISISRTDKISKVKVEITSWAVPLPIEKYPISQEQQRQYKAKKTIAGMSTSRKSTIDP